MNKMNRRVMSFLLVLAMFVSLIPSNVFTVFAAYEVTGGDTTGTTEQETAKNEYEANVGKQAIFDWWEKFLLVDDPTRADISDIYGTDTNTAHIDGEHYWYLYEEEFEESSDVDENGNPIYVSTGEPFIDANEIVMKIVDFYYDDANGWYWYKVDSKDLPEKVQNKPWILYRTDVDMELGFEDPYLCIYDADEVIQFVTSETITVIYMRDENDELVNDDNGNPIVLKTDKLINHYVISGPSALENAKININTIDSYPVSALSYMEDTYSTTFSKGFTVSINKANGTAWTPEDGMVSIRYEMTQFGSDSYTGDVYFGAAFLYIEDSVYSADATERDYDISDVVYTNTALSTLVFEHMPTDFLSLNYKGYYTTEQVNVYNNTLSAYTTITATEFVKVLYSFTQLIYTQVEKEVEKKDEAGNPVVDDNGNPVMETVVETVVDQQIPWYWIERDGQYFLVRQESITFESEEVIDTKFVFKSWVVEVDVYSDPELYPYDYELVDIALFDGVYKVSGSYYDEESQMLFYRLECCVGDTWPTEYDEYRCVPADLLEETDQGLANPIVDFTNAAPLFGSPEAQPAVATYMARSAATFGTRAFAARSAVSNATNGLALYKDVTSKGNGIYEIVLEAYTTGTVTVSTVTKPMDIVLVIDQSGSMSYCIEHGQSMTHNVKYTQVSASNVVANGTYYIKYGSSYQQVYDCPNSNCANWHTTTTHSNSWNNSYSPSNTTFYTGTTTCTRRYDALVDALNEFVQSVQSKTRGENGEIIDHRIAIVGFSSDDYNNTELLTGVTINTNDNTNLNSNGTKYYPDNEQKNGVQYGSITDEQYRNALQDVSTSDGYSDVTAAIGALTAHGGTETLDGMNMAYEILNQNTKKDENRDQVVILFTDGATNSTRSTLLNKAYDIKHTLGATVYGVGIFSGANGTPPTSNPTDITNDNQLMHLISSNYPSARYGNRLSAGTRNPLLDNGVSYYLSASDADALREIFQNISTTISNAASELNQEATIRDIVTPQFIVPANTSSVSVYQIPYTGTGESWGSAEQLNADEMVKINSADNTLSVTGFDFKHNFVSETGRKEDNEKEQGSFYGRKIRIVFTVTENPDFLGGSNAHTNGADSGVYDANGNPAGLFNRPTVNVPLKEISTVAKDKHIYYGNTTDLTGILNLHVTASTSGKSLQELANGINNAYVNLKYTITINNQDVVYYTIPAGALWNEGTWTKDVNGVAEKIEMDKVEIENDTPYGIVCDMTDAGGSLNPTKADGNAIIYVYKPTLTFQDSIQDYKKNLNKTTYDSIDAFLNTHFVKDATIWARKDGGLSTDSDITMEGAAPEFSFEFTYDNKGGATTDPFRNNVMNATRDVPVSVTVTIQGKHTDGTDATAVVGNNNVAFTHAECTHENWPENVHFIVHVIGALTSLTIQKQGWNALDPNQTYLFRVTGMDADGRPINVVVTVHENRSVTIDGLVIGNKYTVTELTDWSWRYAFSRWSVSGATSDDNTSENGAEIKLGETGNVIIFENTREQLQWLDGDAWCDNRFYTVTTPSSDDEDEEA